MSERANLTPTYHLTNPIYARRSYPTPETNGCESGLPSVVDSNYKQYKKLQLVYLMATKYQREREWKFGWFVRVRPDMAWLVAVEVEVSESENGCNHPHYSQLY